MRMATGAKNNQENLKHDNIEKVVGMQPPALWPSVTTEGLVVAPVLTGSFWLALIKETTPGTLTPDQHKRLDELGFRKGSAGRLMRPGRMSIENIESLGRILNAPLDVTQPDQLIYLKNGDALEPAVPLEIQAGIRWYWKTHPQQLLTEIQTALGQREDELSTELLSIIDTQRIENRTRLRRWVANALSGEISAVTEPILGLGLLKAAQAYGSFEDWPSELQEWHARLAEERGEKTPQAEEVKSGLLIENDLAPDYRPGVGTRIQWMEGPETIKGVIIEHDPESRDELWVTSARPRTLDGGIVFPDRQRITVDDILGFSRPQKTTPATPEPVGEPPVAGQIAKDDNLQRQADLTVPDLDPDFRFTSKGFEFSPEDHLLLEASTLSGIMHGQSPLLPGYKGKKIAEHWPSEIKQRIGYTESKVKDDTETDATIIVRDLILDRFNLAQPKTQDGETPLLAVYPMPIPGEDRPFAMNHETATPDAVARMRDFEFCFIGVHPKFAALTREASIKAITEMDDWLQLKGVTDAEELAQDIGRSWHSYISSSDTLVPSEAAFAKASEFAGVATQTVKRLEQVSPQNQRGLLERMDLIESNKDAICSATGNRVFHNFESAGAWVSQRPERIQELADSNDRIMVAISEITNTSMSELSSTPHPMIAVMQSLNKQEGLAMTDFGHTLARMNIDLRQNIDWIGQIAEMSGAQLSLTHNHSLTLASDESSDGVRRMLEVNGALTTTGWLETKDDVRPFQLTFAAETKDLNIEVVERSRQTSKSGVTENYDLRDGSDLFSQIDNQFLSHSVSLGRMIDLCANSDFRLGDPINTDTITDVELDSVPANLYAMPHLGHVQDHLGAWFRKPLSRLPMTRHDRIPTEGLGDMTGDTLNQHIHSQRTALLTMTPAWRKDTESKDVIRKAIKLWVDDQKHLKKLSNPDRIIDSVYEALLINSDAEMVTVATKSSPRKVKWLTHTVTRGDVLNANNDRAIGAEKGILALKVNNRDVMKGWQFGVFDAATALRPQALRLLNERRDQVRRAMLDNTGDNSRPEVDSSKRQDRGVVAGLSIKDLRGKTISVLSSLRFASLADQGKFITKTKLWESPDWVSLRNPTNDDMNNGEVAMEPAVAAFIDEARKSIPGEPPANVPQISQAYAKFILDTKSVLSDLRQAADIEEAVSETGALKTLLDETYRASEAMGVPPQLIMGESAYWRPHTSAWRSKAYRKSNNNTTWTVGGESTKKRGTRAKDETGAMPMLKELKRDGAPDYRAGTDTDEQTMLTTFGFSGIEYGKSMTQADRINYLNQAYDGFMDMAKALKISPQALSLGGTLGLAFGSRGRGGRNAALAHFEPGNNAINLTRMKGAGAMAHEYGHALANYFYRMSRGTPGDRSSGDITEIISRQLDRNAIRGTAEFEAGNLRNPVTEAIASIMQAIKYKLPEGDTLPTLEEGAKHAIYGSDLKYGSQYADGSRSKSYWETPEEMFARSFETWIDHTLKGQFEGFKNDFLVRSDKIEAWSTPLDEQEPGTRRQAQLYPTGNQLKMIDLAFSGLVKTMKEKEIEVLHEHLGKVKMPILYSHDTQGIEVLSQREHETLAMCVMDEVTRMCGDRVWLQWNGDLRDDKNNPAAGRYRDLPDSSQENIERKVLGVIDLAYGAKMTTAHHEAFHFAQSHLLTNEEQSVLNRSFQPGADLHQRLISALRQDGREDLTLFCDDPYEAQAYGYQLWVQGKLDIKQEERPATLFGKVRLFFNKVLNVGQDGGFQAAEQIYSAFYQGKMADRNLQEQLEHAVEDSEKEPVDTPTAMDDALVANSDDNSKTFEAELSNDMAQTEQEASSGPFFH